MRRFALAAWERSSAARLCHPLRAEEHLPPLMVVAGAAGDDPAEQDKVQPYRPDLDDGA